MRRVTSRWGVLAVGVAAGTLLAACSTGNATASGTGSSAGSAVDTTSPVTIVVGDEPSTQNQKSRDAFLAQVKAFEAKYPNITVQPSETAYKADTFQALLAGGQLPTTMRVAFTDIQSLMQRGQVADVTDAVKGSKILDQLNPNLMKQATDAKGHVFGVPQNAYTMGLLYNRALFKQAGLDPDSPPKTWDEVRADAKTIQDKTGVQGFQTMTTGNTGGWVLSTMSYAFGGSIVKDGKTATVNNPATKQALEFYKSLRWDDNTMGSNFLLNYADANAAFAGGKVAMYVQGADSWQNVVTNLGMKPDDYGQAPLPQASGGLGTLGGGSLVVFSPKASPKQIAAAITWTEFYYFAQYTDQAAAVERAKADAAANVPVGTAGLRVVSADQYNQWLEWIKPYVNVPRDHFKDYLSTVETMPLVPEPAPSGQEIYAALDPVVQAVLTRKDADVDKLLTDAQNTVQGIVSGAQQ